MSSKTPISSLIEMPRNYKKKEKKKRNLALPENADPNRDKFVKHTFLIRRSDVISSGTVPSVWSIENHVLILKWVATEENGRFQITNRFQLWNSSETQRYVHLEMDGVEIGESRKSGILELDLSTIDLEF